MKPVEKSKRRVRFTGCPRCNSMLRVTRAGQELRCINCRVYFVPHYTWLEHGYR